MPLLLTPYQLMKLEQLTSSKRDGWVYTYRGYDLVEKARAKLVTVTASLEEKRLYKNELISKETAQNPNDRPSKNSVQEAMNAFELLCNEEAMLRVWITEFSRTPEREFMLTGADIVYFDLLTA